MKYTIVTINDKRAVQKANIRANVEFDEVLLDYVNGSDDEQLYAADNKWDLRKHCVFQRGEWGIWFSNLNCWEYAANNDDLIIFEDDALVDELFMVKYNKYLEDLPADADFVSLWVPDNQRQDYLYNVEFNGLGQPKVVRGQLQPHASLFNFGHEYLARAYQGYGGVAILITRRGGQKLLELVRQEGQWSTSDCFYYLEAHRGNLNGYSLKPHYADLINYDWATPTTIHTTDKIDLTLER